MHDATTFVRKLQHNHCCPDGLDDSLLGGLILIIVSCAAVGYFLHVTVATKPQFNMWCFGEVTYKQRLTTSVFQTRRWPERLPASTTFTGTRFLKWFVLPVQITLLLFSSVITDYLQIFPDRLNYSLNCDLLTMSLITLLGRPINHDNEVH